VIPNEREPPVHSSTPDNETARNIVASGNVAAVDATTDALDHAPDARQLKAEVVVPPEHLRVWSILRGKTLRSSAEEEEFRDETESPAAISSSFDLLSKLAPDPLIGARAKREFAIEHLRAAMQMARPEEQTGLTKEMETFVQSCDPRTSGLSRVARGLARADCASIYEILLSFAPDVAARVATDPSPTTQKIIAAGSALKATRRQL